MRVSPKFVLAALIAITAATPAKAVVTTSLSDGDSTPNSITVVPGATFTVTASLLATQERVTGVDYYLTVSGAAAGKVRIVDRNTSGSQFSDLIKADTGDNGANPGVEDSNFSLLNPRNGLDLGASIANVSSALNPGNYVLGTYLLSVAANTPNGTYTLSTTADPGTGYVKEAPFFEESAFNAHGSIQIVVQTPGTVPEPSLIGCVVLVAGLLRRNRK